VSTALGAEGESPRGPAAGRADPEPGLLERIAARYLRREAVAAGIRDRASTEARWEAIRRTRLRTVGISAIAGALGVVLLYLPRQVFPATFSVGTLTLALGPWSLEVPVLWTLYGLGLAVAELGALVALNVRAVRDVARACAFPDPRDPDHESHLRALVTISVERDAQSELRIGLNPWQGYSRARIVLIFVLSRVKATLSNLVVKLIVRRVLGRYAVRLLVDLAGIPVMAAWNAYAAHRVVREATARILAPELVGHCARYLERRHGGRPAFAALLYDVLQFVAVNRRAFHENHYLLSTALLRTFAVPVRQAHEVGPDFVARIRQLEAPLREDVVRLIVVGAIVDGRVSRSERRAIRALGAAGLSPWSCQDVEAMAAAFMRGRGPAVAAGPLGMTL
jgi:hypothetical protein